MLNRTIAPGEKITLTMPDGREITIVALEKQKRGRSLSLGIAAPQDVKINPSPRKHSHEQSTYDQVQSVAGN